MKIILVAINAKYIHTNLAVRSIYSYCREFSDVLEICEFTVNNTVDAILMEIYQKKPDAVCFSCYLWNIEYVEKIASSLKMINQQIMIVVGGPEVSYDTDGLFRFSDAVVIGEGEGTMHEIIKMIIGGGKTDFSHIKGVIYQNDNKAVYTGSRAALDLADIPFPYGNGIGLPENKIIYYESSRGCPYNCAYCLSSVEKGVRFASLNKVLSELDVFLANKVRQVKFIDRTFNCDAARAYSIWRYIIDNDNGITNFHFEITADLMNREQLMLLSHARPKLIQLEIGVQSTNKETLNQIDRRTDLDRLYGAVKAIAAVGNIETHVDLIAGLPHEDLQSFKQSFDDTYALKPSQLQLGFLKLLKGSALRSNADRLGIKYNAFPPYEVVETKVLLFGDIIQLKRIEEMLEIYYNSGHFKGTLEHVAGQIESPFDFFGRLSSYWYDNGYNMPQSKIKQFEILDEFLRTLLGDLSFREFLRFDFYQYDNIKNPPAWAANDADIPKRRFYENENMIARYVPHHAGKPSSEINRCCNIGCFDFGNGKRYYLFDYAVRDRSVMMSGRAAAHDITNEIGARYDY